MLSRRKFLSRGTKASLAAATMPLWMNAVSRAALAQGAGSSYKAIVMITLLGGNDSNNMVIPLDAAEYREYCLMRTGIALQANACLPLQTASGAPAMGLHPALPNIQALFNSSRASIVANVGPLGRPLTKQQIVNDPSQLPESLLNHPVGQLQWGSSGTTATASTGWGGRVADQFASQSGQLPAIFNTGNAALFTVGQQVQAISVQATNAAFTALPAGFNSSILRIAQADSSSPKQLVAQAASLRASAMQQQAIISQAQSYGANLATVFPTSPLSNALKAIAQIMAGRSVTGASRQIFYCEQTGYDTHVQQNSLQPALLSDLDQSIGAFMSALKELGLLDSVLVCTSADFNRTMQMNSAWGTDHGWGGYQFVLGAVQGGKIIGQLPTLEIGGPSDLYNLGIWIPTTSVTQMAAGISGWMGLSTNQLNSIFPDLANFPNGAISV